MKKVNMDTSKPLRRILSAMLTIVMALALAVPAFAAEIPIDRPDLEIIAALFVDWDGSYELPDLSELSESDQEIVKAMVDAAMLAREAETQVETQVETEIQDEVPAAISFSDVPTNHTFYASIMDCASKSITSGYADGTFKPGNFVTRAQFAVMLSRAFFPTDVKTLQDSSIGKAWYWANLKTLSNKGLLNNTSFAAENGWVSTANVNISRYDMAQLMCNIMTYKGKTVTTTQKTAAQSKMSDWKNIPSKYQDAVATVYALGIITGYSNGTFGGNNNMNRGQGCVVIYRMMQYTPAASKPVDDGNYDDGKDKPSSSPVGTGTQTSEPSSDAPASKPTTIAVSYEKQSGGNTMVTVADNGYATGTLNNGKPITEANVIALIQQAQSEFPQGMSWADTSTRNTNYFNSKNAAQTFKVELATKNSMSGGCGGFAALINNYVFGLTNNPIRKLTDNSQAKPGDIVVMYYKNTGTAHHVSILTGYGTNTVTGKSGLTHAGGGGFVENGVGIVDWNEGLFTTTGLTNGNSTTRYEVWTRYPA